ncbi:hypothetical protein [Bacillus velezensis]|uniref:hypothetical protein n=1 Tax=Bacillus velezensis TaxID=492670 RepID=UPI003746AF46
MKSFGFNNERIKESAKKLGVKMRHDDPGVKGSFYIVNEDGTEREASADDLLRNQ